jgi:hypothetical protein
VTTTEHLEDLRRSLSGQLVTPDEVRWDEARTAWNLAADQHPSAVAFPESAADV